MEIEELRLEAKKAGIKSYWNKKQETLLRELGFNVKKDPVNMMKMTGGKEGFKIYTAEDKRGFIKHQKFNVEHMKQYARELGATSMIYRSKKQAFECFKDKKSIEFLSVSMFQ